MYDGYGNGYGMSGMWVFGLLGLLLLAGIVLLAVIAIRAGRESGSRAVGASSGPQSPQRDSPREVLDHRYARGEVETEEYRERVRTLSDSG